MKKPNFFASVLLTAGFGLIALSGSYGRREASEKSTPSKVKIIYVYDALCGWCFGFSPVMKQFNREFGNSIDLQIISGGLRVGTGVGTIDEVAPFIKTAYKTVEEATGVKFGERFVDGPMKTGTFRLNSLPPAIALAMVRKQYPEKALAFTEMLHQMYYVEGINPDEFERYGGYAAAVGCDPAAFIAGMNSEENRKEAEADFQKGKALGVTGFPVVMAEKNGKFHRIAEGYISYPELKARYLNLLNP